MMRLTALLFCALICGSTCAADIAKPASQAASAPARTASSVAASVGGILRRADSIIRSAQDVADPTVSPEDIRYVDEAARIAGQAPRLPLTAPERQDPRYRPPPLGDYEPQIRPVARSAEFEAKQEVFIFVSDSMSLADLRASVEVASRTGASVVFRGVRKGASVSAALGRMAGIGKGIEPLPDVVIDPRPYERFSIALVPAVVVATGSEFTKVSGTLSVEFVKARFDAGAYGDLGSRGATFDIAEVDMMEEMKSRLESMDWEGKKKAAVDRAWHQFQMVSLPNATSDSDRLVDPSVTVEDDIKLPDGRVLAAGGTKFNPLEMVPFTKTIIIINGTDPSQVQYAKRIADQLLEKHRGVVLMTTELNRDRGWAGFREINESLFPHRLYLLTPEIVSRFGVASVPTVVRADGLKFRLSEVATLTAH